MRHIIIIPARNEAAHIGQTLKSLLGQSEPADRIYVVDDGSQDQTAEIVDTVAQSHPEVVLIRAEDRGFRRMGGGVVDAFNLAYQRCRHEQFTYISKIDADLILPPNYWEVLLGFLDAHPEYAAAGGIPHDRFGDRLLAWRMPASHVPGPLKTFRKDIFDAMGGFIPTLGWDIIDLVKARSMGYQTGYISELPVVHLRPHGSAEGALRGKAQWGKGAYVIGSHPLFVVGRAIYRMWEPPYIVGGLAVLWGYLRAALERTPQITDQSLIATLRREQMYRLGHFNRLKVDR